MKNLSPVRAISLREQVVEQIRIAIIEGQLKPGDRITEKALTDQLNVSRTPIREALILLEREGLIVSVPYHGNFVRNFTVDDVSAIFSMRTTLENFAAQLNYEKFDDDDHTHLQDLIDTQRAYISRGDFKQVRSTDVAFHRYIINFANHPLLIKNWAEIGAQIAALLYLRAEAIPDYDEFLAVKDHQSIVDAYKKRDLEAVFSANKRINERVAGECLFAVKTLLEDELS